MSFDGKTVLDNSVIMYTNELSDGKGHSYTDLPYILAGSCGGYFKQGQYVLMEDPEYWDPSIAPHNVLLNTIVPRPRFGLHLRIRPAGVFVFRLWANFGVS